MEQARSVHNVIFSHKDVLPPGIRTYSVVHEEREYLPESLIQISICTNEFFLFSNLH